MSREERLVYERCRRLAAPFLVEERERRDSMSDPPGTSGEGMGRGTGESGEAANDEGVRQGRGPGLRGRASRPHQVSASEASGPSVAREVEGGASEASDGGDPTRDDDRAPWERNGRRESDWHRLVDYLDALYRNANGGAKPTWSGYVFGRLKKFVELHGIDEVRKRATNMWNAPPRWPPPPHDLDTLFRFFDRFAVASSGDKRAHDGPQRRDPRAYYGEVGEVDLKELGRLRDEARARGEKYMGPTPMKGGRR